MERAWWDDEPELFDAALRMLADWDTSAPRRSIGSLENLEEDGEEDSRLTKNDTKLRNQSRERQKREIQQLRIAASELERTLVRLQKRQMVSSSSQSNAPLVVWENATRRQLQARRRAEAFNAKLRGMIQQQAMVARDLMLAIERIEEAQREFCKSALIANTIPVPPIGGTTSDQELSRRLARISESWSSPFRSTTKFQTGVDDFMESTSVHEDTFEVVEDFHVSRAFPFAREQVERECWAFYLVLASREENFWMTSQFQSDGSLNSGGFYAVLKNGINGARSFRARLMSRRSRDENGNQIITSTWCGCPDESVTGTDDVLMFRDSWARFVSEGDEMTRFQYVSRCRIRFTKIGQPDKTHANEVKKFIQRVYECVLRAGLEEVERRLMLNPSGIGSQSTSAQVDGAESHQRSMS